MDFRYSLSISTRRTGQESGRRRPPNLREYCRLLLLIGLLLATSGSGAREVSGQTSAEIKLPPREQVHVFLLVGQSNMAGRGVLAAEDRQPPERVITLDKKLQWRPATDPLHFDKPGVVGVGLGRTFGIEVAKSDPQITVALVPCAAGGSPISSWKPGGYHKQTKSHPYDDAIRRAKHALRFGTLQGILWHQGESDAKPELADVYAARLHELIARLRKELNSPDVPFIAGQMGQFAERPWSDAKRTVDEAHQKLPKTVAKTAFVNSDGLKHKGDKVHFDSASYRALGKRYAAAYFKLAGEPASNDASENSSPVSIAPGLTFERGTVNRVQVTRDGATLAVYGGLSEKTNPTRGNGLTRAWSPRSDLAGP